MKSTIYRIRFETVKQSALHKYCDANPAYYKNITQLIPNSQIPDEDWCEITSHETDNPWSQYNQLCEWSEKDVEFTRNVKLEKLVLAEEQECWEETQR